MNGFAQKPSVERTAKIARKQAFAFAGKQVERTAHIPTTSWTAASPFATRRGGYGPAGPT
jgi:hypothetical protein